MPPVVSDDKRDVPPTHKLNIPVTSKSGTVLIVNLISEPVNWVSPTDPLTLINL